MSRIILFICFTALLCNCTKEQNDSSPLEVTIQFDQTKSAGDFDLTFAAIDDARCPEDVACLWPGMARVKVHVAVNDEVDIANFTYWGLCDDSCGSQDTLGLTVFELIDLQPYPTTFDSIRQADYQITIRVQ